VAERARDKGIETVVLAPGQDLAALARSGPPAMSRAAATRFALAVLRHTRSSSRNRPAGGRSRCPWVTVGDRSSGLFWHATTGPTSAGQFPSVGDG
jgi:hypothetical protein